MCLASCAKVIAVAEDDPIVCYGLMVKLRDYKGKLAFQSPFVRPSLTYYEGIRYTADSIFVTLPNYQRYDTGFHRLVSYQAVRRYFQYISELLPSFEIFVIAKCHLWGKVTIGIQYGGKVSTLGIISTREVCYSGSDMKIIGWQPLVKKGKI